MSVDVAEPESMASARSSAAQGMSMEDVFRAYSTAIFQGVLGSSQCLYGCFKEVVACPT